MLKASFALAVFVLFAVAGTAAPGRALTCYTLIPAEMMSTVNSAQGFSGQVFEFKTSATVTSDGTEIPAGSLGYGVVLNAIPASNRARNGIIILEPRFLIVNGQQIQVAGDPADASILTHDPSVVALGAKVIPFGGNVVANEAIKGTDIQVGPGYDFHIVPIGNLQERGPCLQTTPAP